MGAGTLGLRALGFGFFFFFWGGVRVLESV